MTLIVQIIIGIGIIVLWRCIGLIDAVVVVDVEGVDEAGDGNVFAFHVSFQAVLLVVYGQHTVERFGRVNLDTCSVWLLLVCRCSRSGHITHNLGVGRAPCRSIPGNFPLLTTFGSVASLLVLFVVVGMLLG